MKNIKEVREIILEEVSYITESCLYIEEKGYDRLHELRALGEIINKGIEKIYNIRVERGVLEEELGKDYDERMAALYKKSFDIDREIEKMIEDKKEEEQRMTKESVEESVEESVKRWQRERFENDREQIRFHLEYCAEQYDYIEDTAFDDVEEIKLKSELMKDVSDAIHGIDIYEEGDLGRDVEALMEWFKRSKAQVERLVQRFKDEGIYYEGPAYHKASPYELR